MRLQDTLLQLRAILANPPTNTTVPYEALVGIDSAAWPAAERDKLIGDTGQSATMLYLRLAQGASVAGLTKVLQTASDRSPLRSKLDAATIDRLGSQAAVDIRLISLADAYFAPDMSGNFGVAQRGSKQVVLGLAAVGVLILFLATINYINLATVQLLQRQREISMRKVLGADIGRLSIQFIAESLCVTVLAAVLGLVLAQLLLPSFSTMIERELDSLLAPLSVLACLGFGVAVGIVSAAYPVWLAMKDRPHHGLAGRSGTETSGALAIRRGLTVLQFGTALGLSAAALAIAWQTYYSIHLNPGFKPKSLHVLTAPEPLSSPTTRAMRDALLRVPGVEGVAASYVAPGRNDFIVMGTLARLGGAQTRVFVKGISPDFFEVYGVVPVAGRLFHDKLDETGKNAGMVLNASTARALGFDPVESAIGKPVAFSGGVDDDKARPLTVIGVAPDIREQTNHESPRPLIYLLHARTPVLTLRLAAGEASVRPAVEAIWRRYFPNAEFDLESEDAILKEGYAEDLRMGRIMTASTAMSLILAAFGTYVLATYSVQRLTREIVLRKLHGASGLVAVRLLLRQVLPLLAAGALIGGPLALVVIRRYQASFVEVAPGVWWALPLAVAVVAMVAVIAVAKSLAEAMRLSPANALRS